MGKQIWERSPKKNRFFFLAAPLRQVSFLAPFFAFLDNMYMGHGLTVRGPLKRCNEQTNSIQNDSVQEGFQLTHSLLFFFLDPHVFFNFSCVSDQKLNGGGFRE